MKQSKHLNKRQMKLIGLGFVVALIFFASWNLGISFTSLVNFSDTKEAGIEEKIVDAVDIVDIKIDNEVIEELLKIVGIRELVEKDGYSQQSILLNYNGPLNDVTVSGSDKKMLAYFYALNNGDINTFDSNVSVMCDVSDKCDGIAASTFNDILKKYNINITGDKLFKNEFIYDNNYLYNLSGIYDQNELRHSLSVEETNKNLVLVDNLTMVNIESNLTTVKTVYYTFKADNGKYYLQAVNVK